ncbi:hypothetical protein KEM52_003636 [Ascosphaera acerosa]|nr:hypothetical protein KEM52_003636 [Ascosphaera acerosa]
MFSQIVSAARGLFTESPVQQKDLQSTTSDTPSRTKPSGRDKERQEKEKEKAKGSKRRKNRSASATPRALSPAAETTSGAATGEQAHAETPGMTDAGAMDAGDAARAETRTGKKGRKEKSRRAKDQAAKQEQGQTSDTESSSAGTRVAASTRQQHAQPAAPSSHVRFDSEEPENTNAGGEGERSSEEAQGPASDVDVNGESDESSDDEAPEAVGKGAALEQIKRASRKEGEAKRFNG